MNRCLIRLLLAATIVGIAPARAAAPADFAATRGIESTRLSTPRLVEIRLDAPLVAATRPGFPDLRLFDAAGVEIPRAIEPLYSTQERIVRRPVGARPTDLRELSDNRIEARFSLHQDQPSPAGIDIRTPLKDFIRTVRITGSADGNTWHPLVDDAEIHDYTRYMDIRRTEIPLPKNTYRHFSVEIGNASEERAQPLIRLVQANGRDTSRAFDLLQTAFRIDGVSFWHEVSVVEKDKPVLREWPPIAWTATQDPKAQTTEVLIQTGRAPLTRVAIDTPARNFQRNASLLAPVVSQGQTSWRTIAKGPLTRIDLPGLATNALALDFPEQRVDELRLVLQNADNPPLDISGVTAHGPVYRLLWLAEPAAAYQLAFGNGNVSAPAYDLFAIRAALDKGLAPLEWTLEKAGDVVPVKTRFSLSDFLARPLVFGSLLALAALALLLLLAKALKKAA
jgi:hypothetical protein